MYGIPYYQPAELVAVGVLNFQNANNSIDCLLLESYANKLLEMSERSSQGYYILAACSEFKNQFDKTFEMINHALEYDPLNTVYRVARVAYFINISDFDNAQREIDIIQGIDPNTEQFSYVKDLFEQKKKLEQK
jgi:tetratricopeptide (TPR) repeat protein